MVQIQELADYLNLLLEVHLFKDYCPNGLQVDGKPSIRKIISGVTANQALIEAAITQQADAIMVHHGFFWKNEPQCLTGMRYKRLRSLLVNDISLFAYHLPLDAHLLYGNNVQLGHLLGIKAMETFAVEPGLELGFRGVFESPMTGEQLVQLINSKLQRSPLWISANNRPISSIAWCTGGAQDYLLKAIEQGIDGFITGEVSERTYHIAKENNVHFFAAGHHATERYGIQALGQHISQKFGLDHHFVDIDNPV